MYLVVVVVVEMFGIIRLGGLQYIYPILYTYQENQTRETVHLHHVNIRNGVCGLILSRRVEWTAIRRLEHLSLSVCLWSTFHGTFPRHKQVPMPRWPRFSASIAVPATTTTTTTTTGEWEYCSLSGYRCYVHTHNDITMATVTDLKSTSTLPVQHPSVFHPKDASLICD